MNDVISVIVPAYNIEKHIERCLESICRQTYKKLEIIVVNDGSTDTTGAVIEKYANLDSRIVYIHKDNGGVSLARLVLSTKNFYKKVYQLLYRFFGEKTATVVKKWWGDRNEKGLFLVKEE